MNYSEFASLPPRSQTDSVMFPVSKISLLLVFLGSVQAAPSSPSLEQRDNVDDAVRLLIAASYQLVNLSYDGW